MNNLQRGKAPNGRTWVKRAALLSGKPGDPANAAHREGLTAPIKQMAGDNFRRIRRAGHGGYPQQHLESSNWPWLADQGFAEYRSEQFLIERELSGCFGGLGVGAGQHQHIAVLLRI